MLLMWIPGKRGQDPFSSRSDKRCRKRVLTPFSYSFPIELGFRARAVDLQRAAFAYRIRPNEDPVLPGGEPPEDPRQHGLLAGEAQARLHAGEGIGREAGALLD